MAQPLPVGAREQVQAPALPTNNVAAATKRIDNFMGHSYKLMNSLNNQTTSSLKTCAPVFGTEVKREAGANLLQAAVNKIFENSNKELGQIKAALTNSLSQQDGNSPLTSKEIKNFAKEIKAAEKQIAKVLTDTQLELASAIGSIHVKEVDREGVAKNVETLAKGGKKAQVMLTMNKVLGFYKDSVSGLEVAKTFMENASKADILDAQEARSQVEKDKHKEFYNYQSGGSSLTRRKGVIGINGGYRIRSFFSKKENLSVLKSFIGQEQSQKIRTPIARSVTIEGNAYEGNIIPLNKSFDDHIAIKLNEHVADKPKGAEVSNFAKIVGDKGISSSNRQEGHLVNGWESSLVDGEGTRIYQALRAGITSDKFEKDPALRQQNSREAAKELIMAAVMQRLADKGLTDEEKAQGGMQLNFNSVSLVTPDFWRSNLSSEKNMLKDQQEALQYFQDNPPEFTIGGEKILVNLNVCSFNFGVNSGAVNLGLGTWNQHAQNLSSYTKLFNQFKASNNDVRLAANTLMSDITALMGGPFSYLGSNQYELGAKIILLSNILDAGGESTKCAFNCMSGKDRTGIMDAVAKTMAIMYDIDRQIPTHADLVGNEDVRKRFVDILKPMLLEMGGQEVVEFNTEVRGYKVGKEARLGLEVDDFMSALGLGKTTSS